MSEEPPGAKGRRRKGGGETGAEFRAWALDPARTNEELFTVELLLEQGRTVWGWKHKQPRHFDWGAITAHRKERRLNPAYRPVLNQEDMECTVEVLADVKTLSYSGYDDRPCRDLGPLRFVPQLEELSVGGSELTDISPVAALRGLRKLSLGEPAMLWSIVLESLEAIAGLPALEHVSLNLRTPWPDLRALGTLPALKAFDFRGNLLALRDVPALLRAEVVTLNADFHWKTPVRSFHDLPAMPEVRRLKVEGVASLEGIGRCPRLLNLEIEGTCRDLGPLAELAELTFVHLKGEQFSDLAPLARLPRLREIVLDRQRPLDVSPLAEAPGLREVRAEKCPALATELSALHAALPPWAEDFAAVPPRPLVPLRFFRYNPQHEETVRCRQAHQSAHDEAMAKRHGLDEAWGKAECRWFEGECQRKLDALLGKGWGVVTAIFSPGHTSLTLRRYPDVMRFRECVQALRELSASCKFPWFYTIVVEPHGDMSEDLALLRRRHGDPDEEPEFDADEERREWADFHAARREERKFLEREHRLRLQQQQGVPINPEEFSPRTEPPPPPKKADAGPQAQTEEDDDEEEDWRADDDDGGVATPPPDDPASDFAKDLGFMVSLREEILWVSGHMEENAAYIFGEEPADWHALPMPPEERPQPA
jgi:hypothetical protein